MNDDDEECGHMWALLRTETKSLGRGPYEDYYCQCDPRHRLTLQNRRAIYWDYTESRLDVDERLAKARRA